MHETFTYQVTMRFEPNAPPFQYGTLYLDVTDWKGDIRQWSIPVGGHLEKTIREVDRDLHDVIQQGVNRTVSYHRAVQRHTAASDAKPHYGPAR